MLTLAVHLWMQSAPAVIYFISLVPLMIFIPGILADRLRTLIWLGFVVMLYFYNEVSFAYFLVSFAYALDTRVYLNLISLR